MMPPAICGEVRTSPVNFPGRVLVVDDEPLVCWSLAAGLSDAGLVAETASSADEALRLARLEPRPDAIVLDSRLHDCNASILLRQLRLAVPGCRFIVMTTDRHAAPPAHDVLIVRKPFDLIDVVRQVGAEVARAQPG